MTAQRLLILGGTAEAGALAAAVVQRFGERVEVTTALAGRTRFPGPIPGQVRIGGFGGPAGLAAYLAGHETDRLIDATHPFASEISAAARVACRIARVPRLTLQRPPWRRHPLDRWIEVDSAEAAAAVVRRIARRAWLTIGTGSLEPFGKAVEVRFLVRLVDPPRAPLPMRFYEVILGRGPFSLVEERHLLQRHSIDVLVSKASGGAATAAKLVAARDLSLPVLMIRRPPAEPGLSVETIEEAIEWLAQRPALPEEARRLP